tara:strand:+ start:335 stop:508 length:174 start_codon:yes stop_codon:yes gene_type:complete
MITNIELTLHEKDAFDELKSGSVSADSCEEALMLLRRMDAKIGRLLTLLPEGEEIDD